MRLPERNFLQVYERHPIFATPRNGTKAWYILEIWNRLSTVLEFKNVPLNDDVEEDITLQGTRTFFPESEL